MSRHRRPGAGVAAAEQIGLSAREAERPRRRPSAPRDAGSWAKKVDRLQVDQRDGVRGTNVAGRRLTGPVQGFGKMWQKTYRMDAGPAIAPGGGDRHLEARTSPSSGRRATGSPARSPASTPATSRCSTWPSAAGSSCPPASSSCTPTPSRSR